MSKYSLSVAILVVFALANPSAVLARPITDQIELARDSASGTMLFVENAGQWPAAARFQAWGSPAGVGTTWLAKNAIWISIFDSLPSAPSSPLSFEERGEEPGER